MHALDLISDAAYFSGGFFGGSSVIAYLTSLRCSGMENRLVDCNYNSNALSSCGSGRHAGVSCVGMRLIP